MNKFKPGEIVIDIHTGTELITLSVLGENTTKCMTRVYNDSVSAVYDIYDNIDLLYPDEYKRLMRNTKINDILKDENNKI